MAKISAGNYDLNVWLYGGYETDVVTVIYGGSGTGKTNFCLMAAVSQAKKGKKVIYIDTEGGFSVERVRQLAGDMYESVIRNILLLKPTDFNEQKKVFSTLQQHLKDEVGLIVVDGLTILYRLDYANARGKDKEKEHGDIQEVNAELARQMKLLAEIVRKRDIPVLVTNQVYRWEDVDRMVGGDVVKYWAKCWIELINERGRRKAILRKHRSLPEKEIEFIVVDEGIKKRGWI